MKRLLIFILISCFAIGVNAQANDTLTVTAAKVNGTIASYKWVQVSGPACTVVGATSDVLVATYNTAGTYVFQCTLTDSYGLAASASISRPVVQLYAPNGISITPKAAIIYLPPAK